MFERDENEYIPYGRLMEFGLCVIFLVVLGFIVSGKFW